MVLGLLLGVGTSLWATTIPLPGGVVVQLKFQNWDNGTLYGGYTDGTYDEAALHPAVDPITTKRPDGSNPGEDGWGIFKMTGIFDKVSGDTLWAPSGAGEITGIFWGLHDYQLIQTGATQEIRSRGLNFAFYYDTTPDFHSGDPTLNRQKDGSTYLPFFANTGTDADLSPTLWDNTDGTLIWSGSSVPGYIGSGADFAGSDVTVDPDNEFITTFNYTTHSAHGGFYADLNPVTYLDGSGGSHVLTGVDNDQFTKYFPGSALYPTDLKFQFTGEDDAGPWLVKSNDPADGVVSPELSSGALMLLGLVPIGLGWRKRRNA